MSNILRMIKRAKHWFILQGYLSPELLILHFFLKDLDVELTTDKAVKRLNCKCVCFLFKFVWLKSLVMKKILRTKFVNFIVKLRNMILLSISG